MIDGVLVAGQDQDVTELQLHLAGFQPLQIENVFNQGDQTDRVALSERDDLDAVTFTPLGGTGTMTWA